jgi:hypothetical protein
MIYNFDHTQSTPLCEIMGRNQCDKGHKDIMKSHHNYTTFYYSIFKDIRNEKLRIFELGIGVLGETERPGASLYGWTEFFPNAQIFGADIRKDVLFNTDQIRTYYCDQTNKTIIQSLWETPELQEEFDIIIDDGLHRFYANVCFFENSIHKLKSNGYYIIEDILKYEQHLFLDKIKEWENLYTDCTFTLIVLPSERNKIDNTLLVIHKK